VKLAVPVPPSEAEPSAEESPVPEQEHLRRQMAEQAGDHRLLAMGGGPHHHRDFDMGPQLDQTEFASLREGALTA
jgi:hypothetical protein